MENKLTSAAYFDKILTTGQIQKLKTAIPYVDVSMQKHIAVYIKFLELQYTISYFDSHVLKPPAPSGEGPAFLNMLTEMKEFCDETEKKNIDGLRQMLSVFQMYQKYQDLFKGLDLSSLLSPDGKEGGAPDLSSLFGGQTPDLSGLFGSSSPDLSKIFSAMSGSGKESEKAEGTEKEAADGRDPQTSPGHDTSDVKPGGAGGFDMLKGMMSPEQLALYEEFLNTP